MVARSTPSSVLVPVRLLAAMLSVAAIATACRNQPSAAERPAATLPPITTVAPAPGSPGSTSPVPTRLRVEVVAEHPHDADSFTQGLLVDEDDQLFESAGQYGESDVRRVDLTTGEVRQQQDNDPAHFAEGLALVGDELLQLTWKEHVALVWDKATFAAKGTRSYDTEGWGLCYDGSRLVMSDGSAKLTFRDPSTFAATGSVQVRRGGAPVTNLNELECVDGRVWANVWKTNSILQIDPASGAVVAEVDATGLLPEDRRTGADVLNGIAHRAATDTFLITGKRWPLLFEVRFVPV